MNQNIVLITGSSRGIGRGIALSFAKAGYFVLLNARKPSKEMKSLEQELIANHLPYKVYYFDVSDYSACENAFSQIAKTFGHIDILINNAGISHIGLLQDMLVSEWNQLIATNLSGVFHCSKLALPLMLPQKQGLILNISSVWGNVGASCEVAYSATKGGVNSFTKALAKELAPSHIRVNAIACGLINTSMNACLSKEDLRCLQNEIPAGRLGTCEEVASLCLLFASTSDYLTGQILTLDGAWQ